MKCVVGSHNRLNSLDSETRDQRFEITGWIRRQLNFRVIRLARRYSDSKGIDDDICRARVIDPTQSTILPRSSFRSSVFPLCCIRARLHRYTRLLQVHAPMFHLSGERGSREQPSGNMHASYAGKYRGRKLCIGIARDFMEPPGRSEQSSSG
jgi:hypothetical protein